MENQNWLKRSDQIFYNMINIRARSHLTTTMSFLSFFIVLEWSLSAILNAGKIRVQQRQSRFLFDFNLVFHDSEQQPVLKVVLTT